MKPESHHPFVPMHYSLVLWKRSCFCPWYHSRPCLVFPPQKKIVADVTKLVLRTALPEGLSLRFPSRIFSLYSHRTEDKILLRFAQAEPQLYWGPFDNSAPRPISKLDIIISFVWLPKTRKKKNYSFNFYHADHDGIISNKGSIERFHSIYIEIYSSPPCIYVSSMCIHTYTHASR